LNVGSSGVDVLCLQRYLNWAGYTIAASGPGSPGNESVYFGPLTTSAVMRWQNTNAGNVLTPAGLTSGTGYFGPLSFNWYVSIVRSNLGLPQ
ncbi:MAG TPA: peptidoglycan-binding domain-containing protein, partial [Candidatus Paceibacterota bacterium]